MKVRRFLPRLRHSILSLSTKNSNHAPREIYYNFYTMCFFIWNLLPLRQLQAGGPGVFHHGIKGVGWRACAPWPLDTGWKPMLH